MSGESPCASFSLARFAHQASPFRVESQTDEGGEGDDDEDEDEDASAVKVIPVR